MSIDLSTASDAFGAVLSDLTASGIVGTPQAQAAAQANLYGVSQSGLNLGSLQIPWATLVLVGIAILAGIYLTHARE